LLIAVTYTNGTATFTNNTGTFNVSGFNTASGSDIRVTGGTYSNGTATFTNNSGETFNVNGFSSMTDTDRYNWWNLFKWYSYFH
jgi:hypothetical protein